MKKLFLLLILTSCSHDYKDPCECDKITDAVTFQKLTPRGIEFETVITTMNVCDSSQTQLQHHFTKKRNKIPKIGDCFK